MDQELKIFLIVFCVVLFIAITGTSSPYQSQEFDDTYDEASASYERSY